MKNKPSLSSFANLVVALSLGIGAAASAQDAKPADAVAGQKKAATCNGCHSIQGYQASFPEVYKVPKIAGQSGKYIVAALAAYRKGERKHPSMRSIAGSLSDQDMADLAAYYEQLGSAAATEPATTKSADPTMAAAPPANVGRLLTQANCASCHGPNYSTPIDPSYPKLAGQHADYLYAALKSYQVDHRYVGRSNAIMMGIARPFTHPEIKAIAQYLAALPGDLKTVTQSSFHR
ncbi:MAG: c-type cytochrome [Caldimonas sp.]